MTILAFSPATSLARLPAACFRVTPTTVPLGEKLTTIGDGLVIRHDIMPLDVYNQSCSGFGVRQVKC